MKRESTVLASVIIVVVTFFFRQFGAELSRSFVLLFMPMCLSCMLWARYVGVLVVSMFERTWPAPERVAVLGWGEEAREIAATGERPFFQHADASRHHRAVRKLADPQNTIEAFSDQINQAVSLANVQSKTGIFRQKPRQPRQDKVPRQSSVDIHSKQPTRLRARECGLRFFYLGKDRNAAAVVRLPVQRRGDLPSGSLQKPHAQACFESLHCLRRGRTRQLQVLRGQRETAPFDDTGEQPHGLELVHLGYPITGSDLLFVQSEICCHI